jgi:hypothetical protein
MRYRYSYGKRSNGRFRRPERNASSVRMSNARIEGEAHRIIHRRPY